jgi:hypothetical protein
MSHAPPPDDECLRVADRLQKCQRLLMRLDMVAEDALILLDASTTTPVDGLSNNSISLALAMMSLEVCRATVHAKVARDLLSRWVTARTLEAEDGHPH